MQTQKQSDTPAGRNVLSTSEEKRRPWGLGMSKSNKQTQQKDKTCKQATAQDYNFVGIAG